VISTWAQFEQLGGVHTALAIAEFEVEVGSCCSARLADRAYGSSLLDPLSHFHFDLIKVGIAGSTAITVANLHQITVVTGGPGSHDTAREHALDRSPKGGRKVDPAMVLFVAMKRIRPESKVATHSSIFHRGNRLVTLTLLELAQDRISNTEVRRSGGPVRVF